MWIEILLSSDLRVKTDEENKSEKSALSETRKGTRVRDEG